MFKLLISFFLKASSMKFLSSKSVCFQYYNLLEQNKFHLELQILQNHLNKETPFIKFLNIGSAAFEPVSYFPKF